MQSRPQDRPLALSAGKSHSPTNGREEQVHSGEGFYLHFLIFDPFLIFLSSIVLMTREGHNHSSPLYHNHNRGLWLWWAAIFQFFPFLFDMPHHCWPSTRSQNACSAVLFFLGLDYSAWICSSHCVKLWENLVQFTWSVVWGSMSWLWRHS